MDDKELSWIYYRGTSFAARITEELYDALHTPAGKPIDDVALVKSIVEAHVKKIKSEIDIIKTAVDERRGQDDHYIR